MQIPSTRELARELGVSRNTVLNAVEQLLSEGYPQGERGSGTYVHRTLSEETTCVSQLITVGQSSTTRRAPLSPRLRDLTAMTALLPATGKLRPFLLYVPAVDAFPFARGASLYRNIGDDRPAICLASAIPQAIYRCDARLPSISPVRVP